MWSDFGAPASRPPSKTAPKALKAHLPEQVVELLGHRRSEHVLGRKLGRHLADVLPLRQELLCAPRACLAPIFERKYMKIP